MGKLFPSMYSFPPENALYSQGYRFIAGVDEAGRGPLAGPVVAAAVILPANHSIKGPLDSKRLSPSMREKVFEMVLAQALAFSFGIVDQREIDRINIHHASLKAMELAVDHLPHPAEYLLIDGAYPINSIIPQKPIIRGDFMSLLIGGASVIAKIIRDRIMETYHHIYPYYNFKSNKGYGTPEHLKALRQYGFCALHRKSFRGVIPIPELF
ncbi:MAG TPA: ribonuclease HII [Thermodesulfobacteriota bacterium]|nr:ribonuclease HII [Thermodesulfobacteriota bacterium]